MHVRKMQEDREFEFLSDVAVKARNSVGRARDEQECEVRTCFQRDCSRIIHCKSFRRLKHKTQCFLAPEDDHYRTRLTHTMEVSQIARTMARALRLNEDLTEAIALGHDLGHPPFGHAGERTLDSLAPGGFHHNEQSLRVVDKLEKSGLGLNLSYEVRNGIVCHTGTKRSDFLEGRLVHYADRIAYINHDIDDGIRANVLKEEDIPREISDVLGGKYKTRINSMVLDIIMNSEGKNIVSPSKPVEKAMLSLRSYLFDVLYTNPVVKGEEKKADEMLKMLFEYFVKHPDEIPADYRRLIDEDGIETAVCDYISGMSDNYAVDVYQNLFVPKGWHMRQNV